MPPARASSPEGETARDRSAAALFHLRHDGEAPSWCCIRTRATRWGICRPCTGSACMPGDVHLNISSPGWAKHAWSSFFAPWIVGATIVILEPGAVRRDRACWTALDRARVTTFCAPPTVWRMLIQQDLSHRAGASARGAGRGGAAEPRGDRAGAARLGADDPGRLRPDGDDAADRQHARADRRRPRLHGMAAAGLRGGAAGSGRGGGGGGGDRAVAGAAAAGADGRLPGRRTAPCAACQGRWYRTGDTAMRNPDGSLTYVGRGGRRVQIQRLPHQPVRAGERADRTPGGGRGGDRTLPRSDAHGAAESVRFAGARRGAGCGYGQPAIFAHLRARLAPYKRVRRLEFADLPKTISGKIRRVELRRLEAGQRAADSSNPAEFTEDAG